MKNTLRTTAVLFVLALFGISFAQTCALEGQWQLVSGFESAFIESLNMGDVLSFEEASGTFSLRLVEDNRSSDGVSMMGSYDIYDYALTYAMNTGGEPMPMTLRMNGAGSGYLYTFWQDGTLSVDELEGFSSNIDVTAEMMGMPLPTFNSAEFRFLAQPGLTGTYRCPDNSTLFIDLRADTTSTPNPLYQMHYARTE